MLPEFSADDLLKIGAVYSLTTCLTIAWLFRTSQSKLPKTFGSAVGIVIRNVIAHAIALIVMCGWGAWTVDELLVWSPLWIVLFALSFPRVLELASQIAPSGGDLIFAAFIASCFTLFVGPMFLLRQLVIGFVDIRSVHTAFMNWQREPFQPHETPPQTAKSAISVPVGTRGVVVANLRPLGKVKVDEMEYNARHVFGQFVEIGSNVEVAEIRDGLLFVKELPDTAYAQS